MFNTRVAAPHSARVGCVRTSVRTVTPARLNVNHVRHRFSGRSSPNASRVKAKGGSADSKNTRTFRFHAVFALTRPPRFSSLKKNRTREPVLTTKKCVIKESGLTTLGRGAVERRRQRVFFLSQTKCTYQRNRTPQGGKRAVLLRLYLSLSLYFFPLPRTVPTSSFFSSSFSFLRVCADNVTDSSARRPQRSHATMLP